MERRIKIFDTTLRDGEQTPGVCLDMHEKLEIAQSLVKLKVDIIEAGFPIASPGDFKGVSTIAQNIKGPIIAGLARANKKDIDAAVEALAKAERPRIHTFIATSDIHMEYKLKMSRDKVLEMTEESVRYAKKFMQDIEFSAEDASRSDWNFLCQVYARAIAAGATVINVPDTVGYTTPDEYGALIRHLREHVPGIDGVDISVHCHNDLGLAVANSLAAVQAGASQVECTMNGLGERAGNAALEELIMAFYTRHDYYKVTTGIDTKQIYRASTQVSTLTGVDVQINKAIVGENAFAHESGIHQHGMLNNSLTYEIISPEVIGMSHNSMVLGKHSGRHAFEDRLKQMDYNLDSERITVLFAKFKDLADRKKVVFDQDIAALITDKPSMYPAWYRLVSHQVVSDGSEVATASVRLETSNGTIQQASCGDGPVNAIFKAIEQGVGFPIGLKDYQVKAITAGDDALGEATVWIEFNNAVFNGRGLSTDIIEASARAYINAINKRLTVCGYPQAQQGKGGE